ncbi:MAG: hypothetical protein K2R98_31570 [Gemmataceae bacterium]|nr:hypothetical protein [Gemmataceae bacterium]
MDMTFVYAACRDAARGTGYASAGYELARRLPELVEDYEEAVSGLVFPVVAGSTAIDQTADTSRDLWAWIQRTFPALAALVPVRRRPQFVEGFFEAAEAGDLVL